MRRSRESDRHSRAENGVALPRPSSIVSATVAVAVCRCGKCLARLSPAGSVATSAACLLSGAFAGWNARDRTCSPSRRTPPRVPALWLEPRWRRSPNRAPQTSNCATLSCKRLATIGPRRFLPLPAISRIRMSLISKAYTQLARIWYRRLDLGALGTLERELRNGKKRQKHDQELVEAVRIAIKLKKGDLEGVVEGMKNLVRDDVPDIYDPRSWRCTWKSAPMQSPQLREQGWSRRRGSTRSRAVDRRLYQIEVPRGRYRCVPPKNTLRDGRGQTER